MKYELSKEEIEKMPDFMAVEGYEGIYEVGKDGTVWSLNYWRTGQRKQRRPAPNKDGYLVVSLCKDGKQKTCRVHLLVLNAYLPKPSPELEVLHKNSKPADNRLDNLKWGAHEENNNDSHRRGLQSEAMTNHPSLSIPVFCVETGEVYPSNREASRRTAIDRTSISACLRGKRKTAGGFHWQKVTE